VSDDLGVFDFYFFTRWKRVLTKIQKSVLLSFSSNSYNFHIRIIDIINTYTLSIPLLPKYGFIVLVGNRKPKLQI